MKKEVIQFRKRGYILALGISRKKAVCGYQLFSRLLVQKTTGEELRQYIEFIGQSSPDSEKPLGEFQQYLKAWLTREDMDSQLPTEYTRLFHLWEGVKPYESVYRGREPLIMQDPWVEVKRFYHERGWYMQQSVYPEDHVAVEMSFMAHLLAEGEEQDAERFFKRHLIQWVPRLLKDLYEHRQADFYRGVAQYCSLFLEKERGFYKVKPK